MPRKGWAICLSVFALAGALVAGPAAPTVCAETFVLKSGGRVRGEWLNREESPRQTFIIKSALGVVSLDRDQVEQVIFESPEQLEYEKLRPTYPDTVEGHVELAEWCLHRQLLTARREHLERVIELDPQHADARTALGYRLVSGEWMTREQELSARGLRMYAGRYRTPQEIEIMERENKEKLADREWHNRLKRWRGWIGTSREATAIENIKAIRDPYAVAAVTKYLEEEELRPLKLILVEVLAKIPASGAHTVLVQRSLSDPDPEVRFSALDQVVSLKPPGALPLYIRALKSKSNVEVNRAAVALRSLKDPDAIPPLIDALVTEHKYKVITAPPGHMSSTFNRGGGGGSGISFGGNQPQIIKRNLPNKDVLNALIVLSDGVNFNYEVDGWKKWYAAQKKSQIESSRRD